MSWKEQVNNVFIIGSVYNIQKDNTPLHQQAYHKWSSPKEHFHSVMSHSLVLQHQTFSSYEVVPPKREKRQMLHVPKEPLKEILIKRNYLL